MGCVSCAEMESDVKIVSILIQIAHVKNNNPPTPQPRDEAALT